MSTRTAMELISTLVILLLAWVVLLALDLLAAGLLTLIGAGFKKAFCWGLLALLIPPLMMLYGVLVERNCYRVVPVEVPVEGLPEAFDGYRIAQISDLHLRSYRKRPASLRRAVKTLNGTGADLIAFTGDLVTMDPDELDAPAGKAGNLAGILSGIQAPDGVMAILGNHDYLLYGPYESETDRQEALSELIEKERALGWDLLLDEHRILRRPGPQADGETPRQDSLAVIGVQNWSASRHFPAKGDLAKASAGTEGLCRILLTHDPTHWDAQIVGQDYPLTLSGHTHAIQFSLLGWCPSRYVFKEYRGLYKAGDNQYLYVNPGLGETIFPARIGVRPEITLITLRKKTNNHA